MKRQRWTPHSSHTSAHSLLDCPECGLPAEIVDRFVLDGSPAPVEHINLSCVAGHWFTLPTDCPQSNGYERDERERARRGRSPDR